MTNPQHLVYLRVISGQVQGFTAQLPKNPAELTDIVLQGPNVILSHHDSYTAKPFSEVVPIYDGQKEEILWACAGDSALARRYYVVIMRIGPHLSLASSETTTVLAVENKPLSVIQENSLVFVSGAANESGFSNVMMQHYLANKTQEGKWDWLRINTLSDTDSTSGLQSNLFQGLDTSMKYIYNISMPEGNDHTNILHYNEMRASQFRQLTLANSFTTLWKSYELDIGYTSDGLYPVVPLITTAKGSDHPKLHLFRLDKAGSCVHDSYFELRKDGSLLSNAPKVTAKGVQKFSFTFTGTPQGLKLMHLGQRVVLLSFDDGRTPVASMATVNDDGGLPVESAWKKINMKYEKALDDTEAKFVTAAVVVPSSFIE